jgi:hypothetical protein
LPHLLIDSSLIEEVVLVDLVAVLGSLLGFAGAYVFTTALRFYNRAYSIDETFENQQEERGVFPTNR